MRLCIFSLLLGCNPEHNPDDVMEINQLKVQLTAAQLSSDENAAVRAADAKRASVREDRLAAMIIIAYEYVRLVQPPGRELTVCFGSGKPARILAPTDLAPCENPVSFPLMHDPVSGLVQFDPNSN